MSVRWTCKCGHDCEADTPPVGSLRCSHCGAGIPQPDPPNAPAVELPEGLAGLLPGLLADLGDALVMADTSGRIQHLNRAAEQLLGPASVTVPLEQWPAHFGICRADDTLAPVRLEELPLVRALRGEDTHSVELFHLRGPSADGVYLRVSGRALRDAAGNVVAGLVVLRDVTREKRARVREAIERELARTRVYLSALMQALPDSFYLKDREHRYLAINDTTAQTFGLSDPTEAVGRSSAEFFAPVYAAEIAADEDRVMAGSLISEKESQQVWADGRARWVSTTRRPLRNERNEIIGTTGLTRDITEHKQAVEALRESESRFRNLFDASPDGIFVESFQGYILDVNPQGCQLQGYPREELIGKHVLELTPPSHRDLVRRGFEQMVRGERTHILGQSWHRDGSAIPVELTARHVEFGGEAALLLHVRDLTERAHAEAELRKSEERFQLAVLGSSDGIWDWDLRDGVVYFSPRWKEMIGYADNEIEGRYEEWADRLHPDDRDHVVQVLNTYLQGELPLYQVEHRLRHKDGTYRWILARGVAFRDQSGRPYRMAGSHTDIHKRKETEVKLRAAQQAAEAANQAKSQFLASISHELRTPLHGIHGLTELLYDTIPENHQQQRDYLQMIRTCTASLLSLINDLLDFSRLDRGETHPSAAGNVELHPQPFDLRTEVGAMVRSLSYQAAQKGVLLACRIDAAVPGCWRADWPRLRQVLVNLLGNALKFIDRGEVILRVRQVPPSPADSAVRVCFEIHDTGIGIPEDKQGVIFDPFVQVDNSTTKKYGGSGLGLSIARKLVAMMGGQISLESAVGRGSDFRVEIPVEVVGERSHPIGPALCGRTVLVVEPQPTHRALLAEHLAELGVTARLAESLARAADLAALGPVDALIIPTDSMPESLDDLLHRLPGVRVLQLLPLGGTVRELPAGTPTLVLGLPLVLEELADRLESLLQGTPGPVPTAPPTGPSPTRGLRVLVAEDTLVNQRLIRTLLEKQGHSVQIVDNGRAAVESVRREAFDVVLMDVSMPVMDGLEATRLIRLEQAHASPRNGDHGSAGDHRSPPRTRRLPIIALTAHALPSDREACLNAGMDEFVPKPVDPRLLIRILTKLAAALSSLDPGETWPNTEEPTP